MRWATYSAVGLAMALAEGNARADQFSLSGFADFRLVAPEQNERAWLDGGLGKLRYGRGSSNFQFGGAVGQGTWFIQPDLILVSVARVEPLQRSGVDLLESYIRYRPASTTPWRWSVKAGAFFAPFSLENTEIGWAPYWTLTPSAINSWFGDEFRTIGAQFSTEWRRDNGTLTLLGAAFGVNDPAGVLMADRGWAMDDRPTGLFEHLHEPDATLTLLGDASPDRTPLFKEFDNRPGWYGGMAWDDSASWHLSLYRYDNDANAAAHEDDYFAWHTKFWDAGFSTSIGELTLIAQAVTGLTEIEPDPGFRSATDYNSAFALLGWEGDEWRLAGRAEFFQTRSSNSFGVSPATSEDGHALTVAVSWLPEDWLKITAEIISLTSTRDERTIEMIAPTQTETQFQLSARLYAN